ncbi:MAG TPA: 7TM-DISM domain-containing protein, partial [Chitinophagaceae bacterium]|nr:7TM-DISM domain-containing protein [Chitinophagaceae bacterium]
MKKLLIIFTLGICSYPYAQANDSLGGNHTAYLLSSKQLQDVTASAFIYTDSTNQLSIAQAMAIADRFVPLTDERKHTQPYSTYWISITVRATSPVNKWWLLLGDSLAGDPYHAHNQYIDAWTVSKDGRIMSHQRTGSYVPRSERAVKENPGVNRIYFSSGAGDVQTVYLKIYNAFYPAHLTFLQLRDPAVGLPSNSGSTLLYVLSAVALAFSLLSLFFFFFVRE